LKKVFIAVIAVVLLSVLVLSACGPTKSGNEPESAVPSQNIETTEAGPQEVNMNKAMSTTFQINGQQISLPCELRDISNALGEGYDCLQPTEPVDSKQVEYCKFTKSDSYYSITAILVNVADKPASHWDCDVVGIKLERYDNFSNKMKDEERAACPDIKIIGISPADNIDVDKIAPSLCDKDEIPNIFDETRNYNNDTFTERHFYTTFETAFSNDCSLAISTIKETGDVFCVEVNCSSGYVIES